MAPKAPRLKYVLLFTNDPPAADIVREDSVLQGTVNVGEVCTCTLPKPKGETEEVEGHILLVGKKVDLSKIKVGRLGEIVPDDEPEENCVKTRRQEKEKARYNQNHAQDHILQGVAENLLDVGPDAVYQRGQRQLKVPKKISRPKKRPEHVLESLKTEIANLECWHPSRLKVELIRGRGVYADHIKLGVIRHSYSIESKDPPGFYRALVAHLMTRKLLLKDGISSKGKRGCVGIPDLIKDVAFMYVKEIFSVPNEAPPELFSIQAQTKMLINNLRIKSQEQQVPSADGVRQVEVPSPANRNDLGPDEVPQPTQPSNEVVLGPNGAPQPTLYANENVHAPDYVRLQPTVTANENFAAPHQIDLHPADSIPDYTFPSMWQNLPPFPAIPGPLPLTASLLTDDHSYYNKSDHILDISSSNPMSNTAR